MQGATAVSRVYGISYPSVPLWRLEVANIRVLLAVEHCILQGKHSPYLWVSQDTDITALQCVFENGRIGGASFQVSISMSSGLSRAL